MRILFLALAVSIGVYTYAQSVADALRAQRYLEKHTPGFVRAKLDNYLRMIGIKDVDSKGVGGSNRGLINYNEHLIENNECFKELDSIFHKEEDRLAKGFGIPDNNLSTSTENTKVESGWQWDLALRVANNDPNLAIMLIGQCGHDDQAIDRPECTGGRDDPRYTSGSLGKETILSESVRDEITSIQAPNKGASALPSKYYHTIGAAYTACALVREGVPGFIVKRIQTASASTYRMMNLCNNRSNMATRGQSLMRILKSEKSIRSIDDVVDFFRSEDISDQMFEINGSDKPTELVNAYGELYEHFRTYGYIEADREIMKKKLQVFQSFYDANSLFRSNIVRNDNCMSPQITNSRINKMRRSGISKTGCSGLNRERCMAARNRILTWWADFNWTEAQHLKGAEFAIKNCRKEPNFLQNLNQKSCDAVTQFNKTQNPEESIEVVE